MEGFSFDNVMDGQTLLEGEDLFTSDSSTEETEENTTNTEVVESDLFDTSLESVGGENTETEEKTDAADKKAKSPVLADGFYSSIALALKEDGILSSVEDTDISTIKTPDEFGELLKKEIAAKLSDETKRIKSALEAGVEPSEINQYEQTIKYLDTIEESTLQEESEEGELLRKRIIYQDYINRGFASEKAVKEVEKSIAAGSDIDDALEALVANKEHFSTKYTELINSNQTARDAGKQKLLEESELLKKTILDSEEPFKGIKVDKATRGKIYQNIAVPDITGADGRKYTAVQHYQMTNPTEFLHKLGLLFTLTDGLKDLDKVVKGRVQQAKNTSLSELEHKISGSRVGTGSLSLVGDLELEDTESYAGLHLDI